MTDTSDGQGRYAFSHVRPGIYNVVAVQLTQRTRMMITDVKVYPEDTIVVLPKELHAPGNVTVVFQENTSNAGCVYIPGTDMSVRVPAGSKRSELDSVPAGIMPEIRYSTAGDTIVQVRKSVAVLPSKTTTVANLLWSNVRNIYLNTSSTGADIAGDVYGFPVLVRLTSKTFDFTLAKSGGEDIRFTSSNGTALSYEIESWDAETKNAELWVKVDTVRGNDSTQYISMYYGNNATAGSSNSFSVFDTANKFISVWHMNENPSLGASSIKDRTVNAHNATPNGSMTGDNSVNGPIGKALRFDGVDDGLNAGNVSVNDNYTVGLWVQLNAINNYERFLTKDSSYTLWYDKDSVSVRMEHMSTTTWWQGLLQDGGSHVTVTPGEWYLFTATFDGNAIRLYDNGVELSKSRIITVAPRLNTKSLWIGSNDNSNFCTDGIIDEVRIEGVARSSDWIRLCYMNQRTDDKLTQFK